MRGSLTLRRVLSDGKPCGESYKSWSLVYIFCSLKLCTYPSQFPVSPDFNFLTRFSQSAYAIHCALACFPGTGLARNMVVTAPVDRLDALVVRGLVGIPPSDLRANRCVELTASGGPLAVRPQPVCWRCCVPAFAEHGKAACCQDRCAGNRYACRQREGCHSTNENS